MANTTTHARSHQALAGSSDSYRRPRAAPARPTLQKAAAHEPPMSSAKVRGQSQPSTGVHQVQPLQPPQVHLSSQACVWSSALSAAVAAAPGALVIPGLRLVLTKRLAHRWGRRGGGRRCRRRGRRRGRARKRAPREVTGVVPLARLCGEAGVDERLVAVAEGGGAVEHVVHVFPTCHRRHVPR